MEPQMNADKRRWRVGKGSDEPMATFHSLVTNHLRSSAFICGSLFFALPAAAQEPAALPLSVRYKCDTKQSVQVDYTSVPGKTPRAVITTGKAPAKSGKSASPEKPAKAARTSWTMTQVAPPPEARYEDTKNRMAWSSQGAIGNLTDLKTNTSIRCTEYASSR
jgi:hypothetical protein